MGAARGPAGRRLFGGPMLMAAFWLGLVAVRLSVG